MRRPLLRREWWLGGRPSKKEGGKKNESYPTFDRIRLRQLRAVLHQLLRDTLPRSPRLEPEVDMCAGEVVGVELSRGGKTHWYRRRAGARKVRGREGDKRTLPHRLAFVGKKGRFL